MRSVTLKLKISFCSHPFGFRKRKCLICGQRKIRSRKLKALAEIESKLGGISG